MSVNHSVTVLEHAANWTHIGGRGTHWCQTSWRRVCGDSLWSHRMWNKSHGGSRRGVDRWWLSIHWHSEAFPAAGQGSDSYALLYRRASSAIALSKPRPAVLRVAFQILVETSALTPTLPPRDLQTAFGPTRLVGQWGTCHMYSVRDNFSVSWNLDSRDYWVGMVTIMNPDKINIGNSTAFLQAWREVQLA